MRNQPRAWPATAFVIGASRGIGHEFVRQLAAAGTMVFAGVRVPPATGALSAYPAVVLETDYARPETLAAAAEVVGRTVDGLDLLVNCGGVNRVAGAPPSATKGPVGALQAGPLELMFSVNVIGPILATQACWPLLATRARSVVANLSTVRASFSAPARAGSMGYAASKAALNMATRVLAAEAGRSGPAVVALDPGWVATDMGGTEAPLRAAESVAGMLAVIRQLPEDAGGHLFTHDGGRPSW